MAFEAKKDLKQKGLRTLINLIIKDPQSFCYLYYIKQKTFCQVGSTIFFGVIFILMSTSIRTPYRADSDSSIICIVEPIKAFISDSTCGIGLALFGSSFIGSFTL